MAVTHALVQRIEGFAVKRPDLYEALRDIVAAINNETARERTGTATLRDGLAVVSAPFLTAGATVEAWYAVEDPTVVVGILTCPPSKRLASQRFTIQSSDVTDASAVEWRVVNP